MKETTLSIDASTMETNAAIYTIVRRDSELSNQDFVKRLANKSGIDIKSAAILQQLDPTRKKTLSNMEWKSLSNTDGKIMKMKDGNTRLATWQNTR